ncbi:1151_t:CDS:2, partial [Funneliformis geosporum]
MPGLFLGNDRESPATYPRLLRSGLNNVSMDSAHSVLRLQFPWSYFDKIEIGPFHKSFSAIVGPNGSEKSNVIDALLF